MEALGINWKLLISQAINFLILFGILSWLLYKPVLKLLSDREKKIKDASELAEKTKLDSEKLNQEMAAKLDKAKKEAREIIANSQELAKKESQNIISSAKKESEGIINKSQKQIEIEHEQLKKELRKEIISLTVATVSKILDKKIAKPEQVKLEEEALKIIK
ncbi:MAG: F0F1 ATP synthase subunit B [Patescibacteria group bacterium]|nr:F0F1 ATP synthase subunit B [Patescibacteria group bacterium]